MAAGGGVLRGDHMLAGFIAIKPDNEIARQLQLLANLDDPAHLERDREFEDWFKYIQAILGAHQLWIVEHLYRDNELIAGTLEVDGERVDLGRIQCPLEHARRRHRPHHATRPGSDDLQGIAQKSNGVVRELGPHIQWVQSYVTAEVLLRLQRAQRGDDPRACPARGFRHDAVNEVHTVLDHTTAQSRPGA